MSYFSQLFPDDKEVIIDYGTKQDTINFNLLDTVLNPYLTRAIYMMEQGQGYNAKMTGTTSGKVLYFMSPEVMQLLKQPYQNTPEEEKYLQSAVISGDITINRPCEEVMKWLEENLVLTNPVYTNLIRRGKQDDIKRMHVQDKIKGYVKKGNSVVVPFGCLIALWPYIKRNYTLDFAPTHKTAFADMDCNVDLMDYQQEAVEGLLKAKGGVLKAGCGSGKTYIGIEVLRRLGLRFLWLCGKSDLLNQTMKNFKMLYPDLDVGTITDGEVHMGKDGTISTVQTMINVDYRLYENEFNVVIHDECHNLTANPKTRKMYAVVLSRCKARYKYGLTATPSRQDGLVKLIYAYEGMSPRGTFCPSVVIKDSNTQSLQAEYRTFGLSTPKVYDYLLEDGTVDFVGLINYLAENEERTSAIAKEVARLQRDENRKIALLSSRVEHCDALKEKLDALGIRSVVVTGKTTPKNRKEALGNVDGWDVIISTVALFKEGLDIKSLDTVMIALPLKDPIGIQQSEGRAERPMEGKNQPLFVFFHDVNIPYCNSAEKKIRRVIMRKRS